MSQRKLTLNMRADDEKALIAAVEKQGLLWDTRLKLYRRADLASQAWEYIARSTFQNRFTPEELKLKWTNLRDSFMRNLRNVRTKTSKRKVTGSGRSDDEEQSEELYKPVWKHWDSMQFLVASSVHVRGWNTLQSDCPQSEVIYNDDILVINHAFGSQDTKDFEDNIPERPSSPTRVVPVSQDVCDEARANVMSDLAVQDSVKKCSNDSTDVNVNTEMEDDCNGGQPAISTTFHVLSSLAECSTLANRNNTSDCPKPASISHERKRISTSSSSTSYDAGPSDLTTPFRKRGAKNKKVKTPVLEESRTLVTLADRADDLLKAVSTKPTSPHNKTYVEPTMEAFGDLVARELTALRNEDKSLANKVKFEIFKLIFEARERLDIKDYSNESSC